MAGTTIGDETGPFVHPMQGLQLISVPGDSASSRRSGAPLCQVAVWDKTLRIQQRGYDYLMPARDSGPLTKVLAGVAADPERYRRFGEASRERGVVESDLLVIAEHTVDAYLRLLVEKGSAA